MTIPDGLSFAELNELYAKEKAGELRSMPFEQYFGEMDLSQEQKSRRMDTAEDIKAFILIALAEMYLHRDDGALPFDELNRLRSGTAVIGNNDTAKYIDEQYQAVLDRLDIPLTSDFMATHANMFGALIVAATLNHINDAYFFSEDRAQNIAENEANFIWNNSEYQDAILTGKTRKRWSAIMDRRTRDTHKEANGSVVFIDQPFVVGDSLLMYPGDASLGASDSELVGCRCSVIYT